MGVFRDQETDTRVLAVFQNVCKITGGVFIAKRIAVQKHHQDRHGVILIFPVVLQYVGVTGLAQRHDPLVDGPVYLAEGDADLFIGIFNIAAIGVVKKQLRICAFQNARKGGDPIGSTAVAEQDLLARCRIGKQELDHGVDRASGKLRAVNVLPIRPDHHQVILLRRPFQQGYDGTALRPDTQGTVIAGFIAQRQRDPRHKFPLDLLALIQDAGLGKLLTALLYCLGQCAVFLIVCAQALPFCL